MGEYRYAATLLGIAALVACTPPPLTRGVADEPLPASSGLHVRSMKRSVVYLYSERYLLFLPDGYESGSERWPLILFLHGGGERGDDIEKVKVHGPPKIVAERPDFPFIVVAPQVYTNHIWSTARLDALLQEVVEKYRVDPDRIYITGLSMGAYGAWHLAMEFPSRFAALVAISGGATPSGMCALKHLPIWVFHGAKDDVIKLDRSEELVTRLECCGANVKFTVYDDAGHDAWTRTYENPELYEWLLRQRRDAERVGTWWRGNTHTHTLWSDGDDFPEAVAEWYKQNGYQFLAITDHNTLALDERWFRVPPQGEGRVAYTNYRERFGTTWVEERRAGDTVMVRLKRFPEYRARVEEPGRFILVAGEEITQYLNRRGAHMNALNLAEPVSEQRGASLIEIFQKDLDSLRAQEERTGRDIVAVLNHPNFIWSQTAEDLLEVPDLRFFEVYNGHPLVNIMGDSIHPGTERLWDIVLTRRLTSGGALLYGVATDDAHDYHAFAPAERNAGRGWVMVRSATLSPASLMEAMKRGDFYASTGVTFSDVRRTDAYLSVKIRAEPGVSYTIQFIGTRRGYDTASVAVRDSAGVPVTRRYSSDIGQVLAEVKGPAAIYQLQRDDIYVRARVVSSKPKANPSYPGEVEMAWTQPLRP
jgi:predicted esterase